MTTTDERNTVTTTTPRLPPRIAIALAVLPSCIAAALTGCSSDPGGSASTTAPPGAAEAGAKIAQCMRDKGYDVDDPQGDTEDVVLPQGVDAQVFIRDRVTCTDQVLPGSRSAEDGR